MGMVRLATVALLVIAVPAFAASVVGYELQLGGNNNAASIKAGTRVAYSGGNPADGQSYVVGVLNWAASVAVSGNHEQTGHPSDGLPTQGLANFVFNLELRSGSGTGPLVTNLSYYSTIHSGTGALPCTDCAGGYTIPGPTPFCAGSAKTYVFTFGGAGPGTVIEAILLGSYSGPFMEVGMYPTVDITNISGDGQLLGVGAGYGRWSRGGSLSTRTTRGIGIPTASGGLGVLPLVEGQIDTSLLAPGTYVLKLVPGTGHNVLRGDVNLVSAPAPGQPEVQAFAVPANQTVGDTITFVITTGPPAVLSVTPASRDVAATAGSTTFTVGNTGGGSLDYTSAVTVGGSWLSIASGGSGTCPPDQTLTLNYTANTGAARSETVRVTAAGVSGSPVDVTVNQAAPPAEPLALQTVVSRRTHGAAGTFNIQFYPNINAVESRRQGVRVAIATFNRNVFCAGGTCDETDIDYFVTNGGITVGTITTQGNVLTVNLSGMATPNQLFLGFSGIEDSEGQTVGDYGCIRFLSGDTDANGTVNSFDLIGVRSRLGQAVTSSNFRRDVDASGAINSFDLIEVRARLNQTIGPCQ